MESMKCKTIKQDLSFFDEDKNGFSKMPLFGRGGKSWYVLTDHKNDEDFEYNCRYSITKSYIDYENDRVYSTAPIQDKEAKHLLKGGVLSIDEDHLKADTRSKLYKNQ